MSIDVNTVGDDVAPGKRRPIVVGAPRTGYALMTVIVGTLAPERGAHPITKTVEAVGVALAGALVEPFEHRYGAERVLFNPNFRYVFGGPRYVDHGSQRLRIRKYLGVIDGGDIIINISLPLGFLNYFPLIHMHHADRDFIAGQRSQITLLQTIRNPAGIINSACHSLNALTSEYLQRTNPTLTQQDIRTEVSFSKMVSPEVFGGLCRFYARNYETYYHDDASITVRWEDTIDHSISVLARVSKILDTNHSRDQLEMLWQRMDHRNLTGHHRHNFREGFGVVGDWKNWLVPQHLEIMRETGLDRLFDHLGYEFPTAAQLEPFNSWQRKCMYCLDHGLEYTPILDHNLRGFSENKSNLAIDRPTVRSENVSVEICGLDAPDLIEQAMERIETVLARANLN